MTYKSISKSAETELIIKHSRFIAAAHFVPDAGYAEKIITDIKSRFQDATHNCYAYIIDEARMRFSDDGEPQGTAGVPILSVIKKRKLERTLIVVTRYYGGIKLGGGGLISAYTAAASSALEQAGVRTYIQSIIAKLQLNYDQVKTANFILKQGGANIINTEYLEAVYYDIAIETGKWEELTKVLMNSNIKVEEIDEKFI